MCVTHINMSVLVIDNTIDAVVIVGYALALDLSISVEDVEQLAASPSLPHRTS